MSAFRLKHKFANGLRVCLDCACPMEEMSAKRKKRVALRCDPCKAAWATVRDVDGQRAAHRAVKDAIEAGTLRPPGARRCVDCGGPGQCYDHRDYSRQLDVDPVCIACNRKRGHGVPASGGLFSRLFAPHLRAASVSQGSDVHDQMVFRSPAKSFAKADENDFLSRKVSEGLASWKT